MSPEFIAELIDNIDAGDPERAHNIADDLLLDHAHPKVREAYMRLVKRSRWWAAA
jgi:hypothetical protein